MTISDWHCLKIGDYVQPVGKSCVYIIIDKCKTFYYVESKNIDSNILRIGNHRIWTKLTDLDKVKLL